MSEFKIYRGKDKGEQCWRWRLVDSNHKNIAMSEESFVKSSVKRSIKTIKDKVNLSTPVFLDESNEDTDKGYRFEYFQSEKNSEWCWRLKAGNHEFMAIGGEGFSSKQSILKSIENVRVEMGRAKIIFENPEDDPVCEARNQDDTKENPSIPPGS
ncbi:hypothetical protein MS2017_1359 [Bathymodiolus thermophilus thioautotrophic gill symbiont]|uniref:DUF1508 domain-containing protein n=1 Tax=Bathymodiolus thermophilus thioautotrophic gill symbiont TaxID=2360 RepID=A0A3G3IMH0_9GAMM|nr:YegP family protein [Bathymodiolus thermophilus thioautotrophic gill symbiont]AYQ57047.1 hypothetical protein MS2017_1359 [Bathymodiolus thermophilus thioautotrophic gill symbiont]